MSEYVIDGKPVQIEGEAEVRFLVDVLGWREDRVRMMLAIDEGRIPGDVMTTEQLAAANAGIDTTRPPA